MGAQGRLERLLVVWCPGLLEEQEDGRGARAFARVVETARAFSPAAVAVRPGVCAVPTRGPSRYFGGDARLARLLASAVGGLPDRVEAQVGVADGLFAAVLAARAALSEPVVVPAGGSAAFLAPWPVEVLERPELAGLLRRLGICNLGDFAALPAHHVLGRLGAEGMHCHELARGWRGEPPGPRVPRPPSGSGPGGSGPGGGGPGGGAGGVGGPRPGTGQGGFWGEAAAAETRVERAAERLGQLLGPEAVVVGRLQGGRGPAERARLVPWAGRRLGPPGPGPEPWPGRLPPPAPVVVLDEPRPLSVVDAAGAEVTVTAAGMASAAPAALSVAGGPWQTVRAWTGPWPVDERWWTGGRRRWRARMQLVTEPTLAYLAVRERAGWWLEGAYD
jgi:hypothetical protein